MIRVGIVGSRFGCAVQLPAFRSDRRCDVVTLAGGDPARTAQAAREAGIGRVQSWADLIADPGIDAVAIAVPPALQPRIAVAALRAGKAVFLEKPLAASLDDAKAVREAAQASGRPVMIDFEFPELPAFRSARTLIADGALGALRQIAVSWQVENAATRLRLQSWKTDGAQGGGVLGNFVSHCLHYLEWLGGPIRDLSAQLFGLPQDDRAQRAASARSVALSGTFVSGAAFSLTMSCASYLGSGHRIECYGEDGTLTLVNETADYIRGFVLSHARRPAAALAVIDTPDPEDRPDNDGRVAPVARLARRFLDAVEGGPQPSPGIAQAVRVQALIAASLRSHEAGASSITVDP